MTGWFNPYGLIFVAVLLAPNIAFAMTHRDGFENAWHNKTVELLEQVGRFGCFLMMLVNPPAVCRGFWFAGAKTLYLILGAALLALYCLGWVAFWKESSTRKALTLSILPSLLFLESGALLAHFPLLMLGCMFAVCHVTLSYRNAAAANQTG